MRASLSSLRLSLRSLVLRPCRRGSAARHVRPFGLLLFGNPRRIDGGETVEAVARALGAYARSDRPVASANDFGVAEVLADRSSVTLISERAPRPAGRSAPGRGRLASQACTRLRTSSPVCFAKLEGGRRTLDPHFPWQPRTSRPGAYEFSQSTLIWKRPAWARCF